MQLNSGDDGCVLEGRVLEGRGDACSARKEGEYVLERRRGICSASGKARTQFLS